MIIMFESETQAAVFVYRAQPLAEGCARATAPVGGELIFSCSRERLCPRRGIGKRQRAHGGAHRLVGARRSRVRGRGAALVDRCAKRRLLVIKDETTPSAWGGGLKSDWGMPSCEFDGGVGGRPVSAPFRRPGEASGVCWLLVCESVSSSGRKSSCLSGTAAGKTLRKSSDRRGSVLCGGRLGELWKDDSRRA